MRRIAVVLPIAILAGCAAHHRPSEPPPPQSIAFRASPLDASGAAMKVVAAEGFSIVGERVVIDGDESTLSATSPDGVRYTLHFSPGLLLVRASRPDATRQAHLVASLESALDALPADATAAPTATPGPPASAFEAAKRAVESSGLRIAAANDADGRIETEWHQGQSSMFGTPDITIDFRVRYVVQVSGRTASARAELQKSSDPDHRSWIPRAEPTKEEDAQLEKLRAALRDQLALMPSP